MVVECVGHVERDDSVKICCPAQIRSHVYDSSVYRI